MDEQRLLLLILLFLGILAITMILLFIIRSQNSQKLRGQIANLEQTLCQYIEAKLTENENRSVSQSRYETDSIKEALRVQEMAVNAQLARTQQSLDLALGNQEKRLHHLDEVLNTRLTQNDLRLDKMRETVFTSLNQIREDNSRKLDEMRKTVDENLHQTLNKRLGESFALVNERLEAVYKGLGEMRTLAGGVGDLKRVLSNIKTRGTWGEIQLQMLLEEALTSGQYEANAVVKPGSAERVEFAVKLPGKEDIPVYLPIDAKFPLEDYERLQVAQESSDKSAVDNAAYALAQAIQKEGARIASKYIVPPYTTDFAILYLPVEGLYAEALRLPGLVERLQREQRVMLAGPTTLLALLNSLQMGFRTLAIEKRSGEVWQLLSLIKKDFMSFGEILDKTQQKLRQASESIEAANKKTRSISRRLKGVETLEAGFAEEENLADSVEESPES